MGICPDNEPDLENRDPNNLNDHVRVGSYFVIYISTYVYTYIQVAHFSLGPHTLIVIH